MTPHPAEQAPGDAGEENDADSDFMALRSDLVRLAFRMTRSREDAEDAVQDVWLRWQRHRGSVTAEPQWLRTVPRNVVIDRLRDRHRYRDLPWHREPSAPPTVVPVEAALELRPGFHALLRSLSPLERVVFVLRDGLDWPYTDIAALLARSESAVRQLRHRSHRHLAAGSRRFRSDSSTIDALAAAYVAASAGSDVVPLVELLAPGMISATIHAGDEMPVHDLAGIVIFHQNQLLLCRRRDDLAWYPGGWDIPGAHRFRGEPAVACAVRAARHELGVRVTDPHLLGEFLGTDFRLRVFEATNWEGQPRNMAPAQHVEIGFFTRHQVTQLPLVDRRLLLAFERSAA